jgi:replicative DNA helicase
LKDANECLLAGLNAEDYFAAAAPLPDPDPAPVVIPWGAPVEDYIESAFALFAARCQEGQRIPFPGDWTDLANAYRGGFLPGLHVLVGSTGTGKTQFALQLALAAAKAGHPVGFLALEADYGYADLVARLADLCAHGQRVGGWSGLYHGRAPVTAPARTGGNVSLTPDQVETVKAAAIRELANLPIYPLRLAPDEVQTRTIENLVRTFRAELAGDKDRPAFLVLDYLQRVKGPGGEDLRATIGNLSGTLRQLATEENLAILALSSTARDKYAGLFWKVESNGARPRAESLVGSGKESGEIEYDADSVLILAREVAGEEVRHLVGVAKQRAGESLWVADLTFTGHKWEAVARAQPECGGGAAW